RPRTWLFLLDFQGFCEYIPVVRSTQRAVPRAQVSTAEMRSAFGPELEFDKPMAPLTSFRTGGTAAWFLPVRSAEAAAGAVQQARRMGLEFFLLGGGSNLLVADRGYGGLIIKMDVRGLARVDEATIECGAGEDLTALVTYAQENGLAGLEFAAGIWGTVGGAIYGNAGAYGGEIGEVVTAVTLVDREGKVMTVDRAYCGFGYRDSALKRSHEIVVSARFRLQPGDPAEIGRRVREILASRAQKHPDRLTAGCFFKNIPDPREPYGKLPAGRLLEEAGAKGLAVGGARVFERHANIIVNAGGATAADIAALAALMKEKVRERFGIELQEEVIRLGEF
ncbi:MAG TPA: UDP-N-acetylmuramate dehydrogenase, partial [candidate division Zixibacteria bacterium]|nr:UDP-N-acetylmuramate dehydrogenase [candidate division Zixibacteria bacterium]